MVANEIPGSVSAIDGATEAVISTVTVGSQPTGLAYDSRLGETFVANDVPGLNTGTLSIIQDSTDTVVDTVTLGANAYAVTYDSGQSQVFVTDPGGNAVLVISDGTVAHGSSTSLACIGKHAKGSLITCTATVTDSGPGTAVTPTGTVAFSSNKAGSFSSTTCSLSGSGATATCVVTFTPSKAGLYRITASYGGDAGHLSSAGHRAFFVIP